MGAFLYYRAGAAGGVDRAAIEQMGLGYAFVGTPTWREFVVGPGGVPGVMFIDSERQRDGRLPEYEPDRQEWLEMPPRPGRARLWLGYWKDERPGPGDLLRPQWDDSIKVTLRDGQEWLIPIVCDYDDAAAELRPPQRHALLSLDPSGGHGWGKVSPATRKLWDAVAPLASLKLARALGQTTEEPQESDLVAAAVALLQANYTVDLPEIVQLEILDGQAINDVVDAASRYVALIAWLRAEAEKKSALSQSGCDS